MVMDEEELSEKDRCTYCGSDVGEKKLCKKCHGCPDCCTCGEN